MREQLQLPTAVSTTDTNKVSRFDQRVLRAEANTRGLHVSFYRIKMQHEIVLHPP